LFGTALPLLGEAFPEPAARARAIGAFGATLSAATAVGPLVGGALVDGPGWRWIFLINVPVGLLTLLACTGLRESRPGTAPRADWAGALTLTASLLALLLGLIRGNDDGWGSPTILGLLTAATALMVAFLVRERTAAEPMLDLSLFARPAFTAVALQAFAVAGTLVAATYYVALYLQNVAGFSPFGTGLRVLPLTVAAFVAAPVTAALLGRVGTAAPLALGLGLSALGLLLLSRVDAAEPWTVLVPGFVVAGIGLGVGSAASASAALGAVEPARAGMATGAVNTMRQVGAAAGVAAIGALFQHESGRRAGELLGGLPAGALPAGTGSRLSEAIGSGLGRQVAAAVPPAVRGQISTIAAEASADALSAAALGSGLAALAATCACVLLLYLRPRRVRAADPARTVRSGAEPG